MSWYGGYPRYVPVAERRAKAARQMNKLESQGKTIEPVSIEGRTIARSFWGKGWCDHLESFSDFANRLPRGRTYVRNGSVCHLAVKSGRLEAIVSGSELYNIDIRIRKFKAHQWDAIKRRCAGQVGSILELLQGKLSAQVMAIVTDRETGLFPKPSEIKLECSCPDWATMCKHVAAVLYGVGSRLDDRPDLLFTLRGVDPQELIAADLALPEPGDASSNTLADEQLSDVFRIDLDGAPHGTSPQAPDHPAEPRPTRRRGGKIPAGRSAKTSRSTKKKTRTNRKAPATADASKQKGRRAEPKPTIRPTGKSVARLRRRLGLSGAAFARELGMSAATVRRWEATSGRLKLHDRSLGKLAALQKTSTRQATN